jgi:hypothetical protein
MSDQFKEGFANIAARKLAKDKASQDAAAVKAQTEREAEAQWQADRVSFQAHYRGLLEIISDHTETLRAAGLSLQAKAPRFDDRNRSGSMTVHSVSSGLGSNNHVSFGLKNGRVTPSLANDSGGPSLDATSIKDANRAFYEGAVLRMLEAVYPPPR